MATTPKAWPDRQKIEREIEQRRATAQAAADKMKARAQDIAVNKIGRY